MLLGKDILNYTLKLKTKASFASMGILKNI
jgi:hypothetical protein